MSFCIHTNIVDNETLQIRNCFHLDEIDFVDFVMLFTKIHLYNIKNCKKKLENQLVDWSLKIIIIIGLLYIYVQICLL